MKQIEFFNAKKWNVIGREQPLTRCLNVVKLPIFVLSKKDKWIGGGIKEIGTESVIVFIYGGRTYAKKNKDMFALFEMQPMLSILSGKEPEIDTKSFTEQQLEEFYAMVDKVKEFGYSVKSESEPYVDVSKAIDEDILFGKFKTRILIKFLKLHIRWINYRSKQKIQWP